MKSQTELKTLTEPFKDKEPLRIVLNYIALMLLLGATYFFAHIQLGKFSVPMALLIATMKMLLVALIFMELKKHTGAIRIAALVGIFWLMLLLFLSLSDYRTRGWMQLPGNWPQRDFKNSP